MEAGALPRLDVSSFKDWLATEVCHCTPTWSSAKARCRHRTRLHVQRQAPAWATAQCTVVDRNLWRSGTPLLTFSTRRQVSSLHTFRAPPGWRAQSPTSASLARSWCVNGDRERSSPQCTAHRGRWRHREQIETAPVVCVDQHSAVPCFESAHARACICNALPW